MFTVDRQKSGSKPDGGSCGGSKGGEEIAMKKLIWLILVGAAFGQNSRFDSVAVGPKGAIPFATVAVCTQPANTSTTPCSPRANLCTTLSDVTCTSSNPLTADSLGNYH